MTQAVASPARPAPRRRSRPKGSLSLASSLGLGVALLWFSLLVLIPLAMVVVTAGGEGLEGFVDTITNPQTLAAVRAPSGSRCFPTTGSEADATLIASM